MATIFVYPPIKSDIPAHGGIAVDISAADFTPACGQFRRLWVGGAGNVVIKGLDGNSFTLTGVPANTMLNVAGLAVVKASTTATLMVALL
jgi:hypothetical protein